MDYIVPPKQVVNHNGQTYGAGDRVPGYTPPATVKVEKEKTKQAEVKAVEGA